MVCSSISVLNTILTCSSTVRISANQSTQSLTEDNARVHWIPPTHIHQAAHTSPVLGLVNPVPRDDGLAGVFEKEVGAHLEVTGVMIESRTMQHRRVAGYPARRAVGAEAQREHHVQITDRETKVEMLDKRGLQNNSVEFMHVCFTCMWECISIDRVIAVGSN